MTENEQYIRDLISEVKSRSGGVLLSLDNHPQAVVLSIERYNELLGKKQNLTLQNMKEEVTQQTVLVTGGAGYIGGHVVHLLKKMNYKIIVLDDFRTGRRSHIPDGVPVVEGNVSNLEILTRIFTQNKIDAVIHLAALLEVEESTKKPLEYFENNAHATYILLQAMEQAGVKNIIFSSTAAVYGEQEVIPIVENAIPKPNNPYGESKYIAEKTIEYFARNFKFNATVLRYFNVAGTQPEFSVFDTHKNSHLIPIVLDVALGKNDVLTVNGKDYPTFDGSCVRDFIHVFDVARAHVICLESLKPGFNVYNIGTGKGFSVEQVIQSAAEISGKMIPTRVGARRNGDAAITVADVSKIQKELGFRPEHSTIENIIATSWQMVQKNQN